MSGKTIDQNTATGTPEWRVSRRGGGKYVARITMLDGRRQRFDLVEADGNFLTDRKRDYKRARTLARLLSNKVRSPDYQDEKRDDRIVVETFGESWTSGELHKKHGEVRKLRIKVTASDDQGRLRKYVYPYIGKRPVADVTDLEIEKMLRKAYEEAEARRGKPLRQATKKHIYMVTHRLFELSIMPGRLRATNPVLDVFIPSNDAPKVYCFLYPDELLSLLACTEVPLVRRIYYALATYTGLRKSSLKAFTWSSVDFDRSTIFSRISKNRVPQMFAQADADATGLSSLITVLQRYYVHCGYPDLDSPMITKLGCRKGTEATTLRMDLDCAGIHRELLFERSVYVEPLRFHDLRATFVTWAKRAGKDEGWIQARTGHLTQTMLDRYDRGAQNLRDLQYLPFPDLSLAIPELSEMPANVKRLPTRR
jgi:integrase